MSLTAFDKLVERTNKLEASQNLMFALYDRMKLAEENISALRREIETQDAKECDDRAEPTLRIVKSAHNCSTPSVKWVIVASKLWDYDFMQKEFMSDELVKTIALLLQDAYE